MSQHVKRNIENTTIDLLRSNLIELGVFDNTAKRLCTLVRLGINGAQFPRDKMRGLREIIERAGSEYGVSTKSGSHLRLLLFLSVDYPIDVRRALDYCVNSLYEIDKHEPWFGTYLKELTELEGT